VGMGQKNKFKKKKIDGVEEEKKNSHLCSPPLLAQE
jgi:hypothetical protein